MYQKAQEVHAAWYNEYFIHSPKCFYRICSSVLAIISEPAIEVDSKSTSFYANKQPAFRGKQQNTHSTVKRQTTLSLVSNSRNF